MNRRGVSTAIAAAIAFVATVAAFAAAIPWRVSGGDIAEAQTVPYILGIAHAPGFPAYTLLGWLFSHAVAVSTVAWRMNVFTTLCVALVAAGIVMLVDALECNPFAGLAAALVFAYGAIVRDEAIYASPHALAGVWGLAGLITSVWFAKRGDRRVLLAACACAGLGLATHPVVIWVLPAIAVATAWQWRTLTRASIVFGALALVAPLLLYVYLPLRSNVVAAQHLDPAAAAPIFSTGNIDWDTNHPRTSSGLLDEVLARHEGGPYSLIHALDPRAIPGAALFWFGFAKRQYAAWLLAVAALGILALAQQERRALTVILAATLGGIMFARWYHADLFIFWYFLLSFAVTAALAAAASRMRLPRVHPLALEIGVPIALAAAAALVWYDRPPSGLRVPPDGQSIVESVARDVPDGAIVVAPWYEAQALGYGAYVEHALGTRTVVAGWPGDFVRDYPAWSRARRLVIYAGGLELMSAGSIPRYWMTELPSSNLFYRVLEIVTPR